MEADLGKICVIGSLNMDLVINTPRIPVIGETIIGNGFMTVPGGKGANQAVAAARLGGEVTMVGNVGDDLFGVSLKENLNINNVNSQNVKTLENVPTGVAIVVINEGNNYIILDSGANFKISPEDISNLENVIKNSDILLLQMEIPQDAIERAVDIARKYGIKVLLNPAPARELSNDFLEKVDILTPNESECEYITGLKLSTFEDASIAIKCIMGKGVKQVVITLGGRGVVYNSGEKILHKPVPMVEVVDTTAAGDSFTGALAVALTKGMSIDDAIDFANVVGTITVTKKGAQTSLPFLEELEKFRLK